MARCPDCSKFVPYGEIDVAEVEVTLDDATLTLGGTINLTCGQCGAAIAAAEVAAEVDVAARFDRQPDEDKGETAEYELAEDPAVEPTSRRATEVVLRRGRHKGKTVKITNLRHARCYYGATAECRVVRLILDAEGEAVETGAAVVTIEVEASRFEPVG